MFEQNFKRIDNEIWKDAGVSSEIDYVEQTSWLLFLKYLEDLEKNKALEAQLNGKKYTSIVDPKYTWSAWAYPKTKDGSLDVNKALTGDDLRNFVNNELFPYLRGFKNRADNAATLEYKIGEIFSEINNRIQSGYILRRLIDIINEMRFQTEEERHELSVLYEDKIQNMGNSGRNGGEYYTPRPLIRTIIKAIKPKIGDRIYDGAVGSAGFLVEAFDYLKESKGDKLSVKDMQTLQTKTLFGKEKKPLPYLIGTMNMILHGVEAPNILHTNTLAENIMSIQEKDRYEVIIANPPFGASEDIASVEQNFPIRSSETAYLFLQHFIKSLKAGGMAGIVIKNTFLSNGDATSVRKELLSSCNLFAILDLPGKVFTAGTPTVVLFFKKGEPTKKIWYYQLNLDRNLGKTNPLNENDLADFLANYPQKSLTENSWVLDLKDLDPEMFDLSVKNPNKKDDIICRVPSEILSEISSLNTRTINLFSELNKSQNHFDTLCSSRINCWKKLPLEKAIKKIKYTTKIPSRKFLKEGKYPIISQEAEFISGYWNDSKDVFHAGEPIVIFGDHTKNIKYVDFDFVIGADGVKILSPIDEIYPKYFYYYLQSIPLRNLGYARHYKLLKEKEIIFPSLPEQKKIVAQLDALNAKTQELEQIYTKKLADLDELKQSILQQAFSSKL